MANYQINRPQFNWDTKEILVELENFKTDAIILFDGPYHKMENNETMSIVLNWLGRQAIQLIKSQDITPSTPQKIYDTLEKNFRPKSNNKIAKLRIPINETKARTECICIFD